MKRTTIMLPEDLRIRASVEANRLGVSLGEFIRKSILTCLCRTKGGVSIDSFFADKVVFKGPSPKDGARNHDRYLYGEKSP